MHLCVAGGEMEEEREATTVERVCNSQIFHAMPRNSMEYGISNFTVTFLSFSKYFKL